MFAIAALVAAATLYWVGLWYRERIHTAAKVLKQTGEAVVKLSEGKIKWAFITLIVLIFSKYLPVVHDQLLHVLPY